MSEGWFKIDRDIFENKVVCHDCEYLAVWCLINSMAAFKEHDCMFNGRVITLKIGQLITSRKAISQRTGVEQTKVERILKRFISAQLIEQQTLSKGRLITVLWEKPGEKNAQPFAQQMHSKRTANAQQMHTNNKEEKERMKDVTHKRAPARGGRGRESAFSSDASYDIEEFHKMAIGYRNYVSKTEPN